MVDTAFLIMILGDVAVAIAGLVKLFFAGEPSATVSSTPILRREAGMSQDEDLSAMSLDELWRAHQMIWQLLVKRLKAQHRQLDEKLTILQRQSSVAAAGADDPMWTKASGRAAVSKPVKKRGNGAAKHMALEKAES